MVFVYVFGNEFNMTALSILFLRPNKCYSMNNISLNVDASKSNARPIYLSLKNNHFTPIVPMNNFFQNSATNGDHLFFINYGCGELKFY